MTESSIPNPETAPYPEPTVYYLPHELGLNDKSQKDMDLYNQSHGVRQAGELLIERRKVETAYELGAADMRAYYTILRSIDEAVIQVLNEHEQRMLDPKK